jgi:uncharacterized protein (DUF1499 family)
VKNFEVVQAMDKGMKFWIFSTLVSSLLLGCSSSPPLDRFGLLDGQLRPCPSSPNCVSSLAKDSDQHVPALLLRVVSEQSWQQVKSAITELPRTRIATATNEYLHAECRSAVFGFVDDLELQLRRKDGRIEVRSAARLGYYDFGVNRERLEQLRVKLHAAGVIH